MRYSKNEMMYYSTPPRLCFYIVCSILSYAGFSQPAAGMALKTSGCGFSCNSPREVCFNDSCLVSTYYSCSVSADHSANFIFPTGITCIFLSYVNRYTRYVFIFKSPGTYSFKYDNETYTITVHPSADKYNLLPKTVYCKTDSPVVFHEEYSHHCTYRLDTDFIKSFYPSQTPTGNHTLAYSGVNEYGCNYSATKLITVNDCSEPLVLTTVYPNPANDLLNVSMVGREGSMVRILDVYGKIWNEIDHGNASTLQISLATMPAGLYVLEFISGTKTETVKFMHEL